MGTPCLTIIASNDCKKKSLLNFTSLIELNFDSQYYFGRMNLSRNLLTCIVHCEHLYTVIKGCWFFIAIKGIQCKCSHGEIATTKLKNMSISCEKQIVVTFTPCEQPFSLRNSSAFWKFYQDTGNLLGSLYSGLTALTLSMLNMTRNIGGSKGGARDARPPWVQILSFSCSFRKQNLKIIALLGVGAPPG